MLGFEALLPVAFSLASSVKCESRPLPVIHAQVREMPLQKRNDLSIAQLSRFKIDTKLVPAGGDHHVGGLMNGTIEIGMNPKIGYVQYRNLNVSCIWLEEIDIEIRVSPVVYIASEYKPGTCYHREVWYHELKHVAVDKNLAKKYLSRVRSKIRSAAYNVGVIGPVPSRNVPLYHERLSNRLQKSIEKTMDYMYKERDRNQQNVDNKVEYERLNRTCGGRR